MNGFGNLRDILGDFSAIQAAFRHIRKRSSIETAGSVYRKKD